MSKSTKLVQTVRANSRGYAYLAKLEGAPDFSKLSKVTLHGEPGAAERSITLKGSEKAGHMLKRGYVAVGANEKVNVEFGAQKITITPAA